MDYCEKYSLEPFGKENVVPFIQKLKTKNQTAQQQKQAYHAVSLFYELSVRFEKQKAIENIDDKIARKKESGVLTNANWVPVYDGLVSEIKLRHYSPKTLKSYRSWVRHFQNYTKSKNFKLLSTPDVKNFLTFLAVERKVSASSQNQAFNALYK